MSGKLHLICIKTEGFHAKIRCNSNDISYLSEMQKNSYNYNYFCYSFLYSIYNNYAFLKIMFRAKSVLRIKTMTCVRRHNDVQKTKWRPFSI